MICPRLTRDLSAPPPRGSGRNGAYLVWHLRRTLAPLTFTDETPPERANPVAPARRSPAAARKAATKTDPDGQPVYGFRELLAHLGTDHR